MGEHAATVDIGDQDHRAVDGFRKTHVGDIARAQIDFGRAARAFDDHGLVLLAQPGIRFQHRTHGDGLVLLVVARIHLGAYLAVDDHLRARV